MKRQEQMEDKRQLEELCSSVRRLVAEGSYEACKDIIYRAMERYPHAPHPHNLLGIILEKTGNHFMAMRHFRAAWALDPAYLPADYNLQTYGTFFSSGKCAFDESDLPGKMQNSYKVIYDEDGIGHVVTNQNEKIAG